MLLFSRQGKVRLQKWYSPLSLKEKKKIMRELIATILSRKSKMCNFLEYKGTKVVYKRCVYCVYSNYLMRRYKLDMQVCIFAVLLSNQTMNFSHWK